MQNQITTFTQVSFAKQQEILRTILEPSIGESSEVSELYENIKNVDISRAQDLIKKEFIKIYSFLMEKIDNMQQRSLQNSVDQIEKMSSVMKNIHDIEQQERIKEQNDIESLLS